MAKLPIQNQILPETFPSEQKKWLPQLLQPINYFIQNVIRALNKNLTFNENFAGDVLTVTIDGTYPLDVRWINNSKPTLAWIGSCREVSGTHATITTALYLDWEMSSVGEFRINKIAGLSASITNPFYVKIVAIVG